MTEHRPPGRHREPTSNRTPIGTRRTTTPPTGSGSPVDGDRYADLGREVGDVLRRAHDASERILAEARRDADAMRRSASAQRAEAERERAAAADDLRRAQAILDEAAVRALDLQEEADQARAAALAELHRAETLRASLEAERLALHAQLEAVRADDARRLDAQRSAIEARLRAALELVAGDASTARALAPEVTDLRDAPPVTSTSDQRRGRQTPPTQTVLSTQGQTPQAQETKPEGTTAHAETDDAPDTAVGAAVARVIGTPPDREPNARS